MRRARSLAALGSLVLASCQGQGQLRPIVDIPAVVVNGRTGRDAATSETVQMDCSIVRWSVGGSYCKPLEAPSMPPQYCTRSLAGVDCWTRVNPFGYPQRGVADGPWRLTPEQKAARLMPWTRR